MQREKREKINFYFKKIELFYMKEFKRKRKNSYQS